MAIDRATEATMATAPSTRAVPTGSPRRRWGAAAWWGAGGLAAASAASFK